MFLYLHVVLRIEVDPENCEHTIPDIENQNELAKKLFYSQFMALSVNRTINLPYRIYLRYIPEAE